MTVFSKNCLLSLLSLFAFLFLIIAASFAYNKDPGSRQFITESDEWRKTVFSWKRLVEERGGSVGQLIETDPGYAKLSEGWLAGVGVKIQKEWLESGGRFNISYANIKENIWKLIQETVNKFLMNN